MNCGQRGDTLMTETGLRPGDLFRCGPEHVHPTPHGARIVMPQAKTWRKE